MEADSIQNVEMLPPVQPQTIISTSAGGQPQSSAAAIKESGTNSQGTAISWAPPVPAPAPA